MRDGAVAALVILACSLPVVVNADAEETIVIGSKNFTENGLLAEIMAQLIEEETDLRVERRPNLGGTIIAFTALESGEIDIYPEYTGTGWSVQLAIDRPVKSALEAYVTVEKEFLDRFGAVWLAPFGFENSYALAMIESRADELGIRRISDLVQHRDELRIGVSHEFLNRADGWPGLADTYRIAQLEPIGIDHGLIYEALETGRIDIVDTWTTDGKMQRYDVRLLEDDLGFFPPYDAAPLVRQETLARHSEMRGVLDKLAFTIDERAMREMNLAVEESGGDFSSIASAFLEESGLAERSIDRDRRGMQGARESLFDFAIARSGTTLRLALEHLALTAAAVALAILVAVPLGIGLTRRESLAPVVLGTSGVIQTIPSLALLAFMIAIPGLGLGARSAIAALFLYALLPIVRNTYAGIKDVDPELIEAARGIGLTDRQQLLRVELPLASRAIMAGIRTATVISIGVATLAAFIGAGGLGEPIVTGLQLYDIRLILAGAVPAALLALIADALLGRLERKLTVRS